MAENPSEGEGRFVEGGSFKVDRARALQKLERFQLPEPWHFVRAWLRLASVLGARDVSVRAELAAGVLLIDGAPLEAALLADPYAALFAEGGAGASEAGTFLAVGLLGCLRLEPAEVALRSAGRCWRRAADGAETGGEWSDDRLTELRVVWSDTRSAARFVAEARAAAGMMAARTRFGFDSLPPFFAGRGMARREAEGRSFAVGHDQALNIEGVANVYQRGVLLQTVTRPEFRGLSVHINDDGLTLDVSHSKAVADQRFWDALAAAVGVCRTAVPQKGMPNAAMLLAVYSSALALFGLVALTAYPSIPASDTFGRLFVGFILGANILGFSAGILNILYRWLRTSLRGGKA